MSFSPDSELILADPAYHDGIGNGVIGMYDLHGKLLWDRHTTAKAQAFYPSAEWEDATHALAAVYQDGQWSMVRMGVDGALELALPPQAGKAEEVPWHFETR